MAEWLLPFILLTLFFTCSQVNLYLRSHPKVLRMCTKIIPVYSDKLTKEQKSLIV